MMKSYKEITGRYLKSNKKRTILTIIGIILSVALISSIGFFFKSMQAAQVEDIKNSFGSWHVMYKKVNDDLVTKIKSNPNVQAMGIYSVGEVRPFNDTLKIKEVYGTDEALKLAPYKIKEGRFPENDKEVAMESWFLVKVKNGAKLGDAINILDKEYTLVGILNDTYSNQQEGMGELLTKAKETVQGNKILLVQLKVSKNMASHATELKKLMNENDVIDNYRLIEMEGQGFPMELLSTLAVIISIVVISTIAVIYNAFQISVVERVKQFGLLRAVGATPKQIRKIILKEATILAVIGVPIGLGFGILALYGIYYTFNIIGRDSITFITPTISMDVVTISVLVGLLSIYISALIPAFFAGRVSPLVAISSRNSITKEKIKRSKFKNPLVKKIFGFEGVLASKNIKRNRKRYRTTVFSIVISVVLFITFKSFMDFSLNVYDDLNESKKIHFSIVNTDNSIIERAMDQKIINKVKQIPQVDVMYQVYNSYAFDAVMEKNKELNSVKEIGGIYRSITYQGAEKTLTGGSIAVYDDKSLEVARDYLKAGSIDKNQLNQENGVIIIARNRIYNEKTEKQFFGPVADLKVGDEILLQYDKTKMVDPNGEKVDFGKGNVQKVKVLAILKGDPFDFRGYEDGIKMISTEKVVAQLAGEKVEPVALNVKIKDVNLEKQVLGNLEKVISEAGDLKVINIIDQNRSTKSVILMVKILLYGFVVVVSLIGCVNIINTLTTNIILRKREFAALKSIGLTQKGLRKMITLEGMLYGIVGSIYGSVIGSILSYMIYNGISSVREQSFMLPYEAIGIAVAGAMLIGYLSVLAPLQRIKKENIIEAVREDF